MGLKFENYNILNLTKEILLIEFLENCESFDDIYSKNLKKKFPVLEENRTLI